MEQAPSSGLQLTFAGREFEKSSHYVSGYACPSEQVIGCIYTIKKSGFYSRKGTEEGRIQDWTGLLPLAAGLGRSGPGNLLEPPPEGPCPAKNVTPQLVLGLRVPASVSSSHYPWQAGIQCLVVNYL